MGCCCNVPWLQRNNLVVHYNMNNELWVSIPPRGSLITNALLVMKDPYGVFDSGVKIGIIQVALQAYCSVTLLINKLIANVIM